MSVSVGIRGMNERARPPRLGKLRLGKQVPNASGRGEHPVRTDYFVTDDDRYGRQLREFLNAAEPRRIPIAFVSVDPDEVAPYNLEFWGGGGLKCRGNGETADALVNVGFYQQWRRQSPDAPPPRELWAANSIPRPGSPAPERRPIPCFGMGYGDEPACPVYATEGDGCKPTMHITLIVRGFPALGVWQVDTNSVVNIERTRSFLKFLQGISGRLTGIPLVMSLEPMQMRGQQYHMLRFDFDTEAGVALPMAGGGSLALPEPGAADEPDEDQAGAAADVLDDAPDIIDEPPAAATSAADAAPTSEPAEPRALEEASAFVDELAALCNFTREAILNSVLSRDLEAVRLMDFDTLRVQIARDVLEQRPQGADLAKAEAIVSAAPPAPLPPLRNVGDFMTRCLRLLKLQRAQVLALHNADTVDALSAVMEPMGSWEALYEWTEQHASEAPAPSARGRH